MTSLPYIARGGRRGARRLRVGHDPEAHRLGQPGAQAADRLAACCWRRRSSWPTTCPPDNNALVIAIMSLAFFGQGMTNLGWTVVSDIAPKKLIGLTGGLFNFTANLAGIVTPIVIGVDVPGDRHVRRPARSTSPSSRCSARSPTASSSATSTASTSTPTDGHFAPMKPRPARGDEDQGGADARRRDTPSPDARTPTRPPRRSSSAC